MSALLSRLDTWSFWQARTARERLLLAILAGVALAALLLVAVVRPLQAARGEAQADIRTFQSLANRLQSLRTAVPGRPQRTGDAAAVVAAVAGETGFAVQGITPDGAGVRVAFSGAGWDGLMRWIATLEGSSRFRVRRMTVMPGAAPGLVAGEAVVG